MDNPKRKRLFSLDIKKVLVVIALVVLTIILIVIQKDQKFKVMVGEQKQNLLSFYTDNLRPLFTGSSITREDIFNFAFYREIPLDRQNSQFLKLGNKPSGEDYFELKQVSAASPTNNLDAFVRSLDLNSRQQRQMDSLLNSYKEEIASRILVNPNNTVAISPHLWNLNKALLADVLLFASKANKTRFSKVLPADVSFDNNLAVAELVKNVRSQEDNKYIFITRDSIFTGKYIAERKLHVKETERARRELDQLNNSFRIQIDLNKNLAQAYSKVNQKSEKGHPRIRVNLDTNYFRVEVPGVVPEIDIPDMEELDRQIEEATKQLKNIRIRMVPPERAAKDKSGKNIRPSKGEPSEGFDLDIVVPDVGPIINESLKGMESLGSINTLGDVTSYDWEAFGRRMDSIGRSLEGRDSLSSEEKAQLKREIKRLKEELSRKKGLRTEQK